MTLDLSFLETTSADLMRKAERAATKLRAAAKRTVKMQSDKKSKLVPRDSQRIGLSYR